MGKHNLTKEDKAEKLKQSDLKNSKKIKQKSKKKKKRIILKSILFILLVLIIVFIVRYIKAPGNSFISKTIGAFFGHNEQSLESLDKLQVLILGESTGMSDTIIVASYDPKTQEASLMSIPRDTFTGDEVSEAKYYHKINALYNYGETPEKTVEAVNKITGLDLKYYIIVDTEALRKLVDTIDGLEFDVPIDMNYDDSTQNLHIHLKAGEQTLTGAQVEQLVRFRHNNNGSTYPYSYGIEDHGRSKTQRNVIIAIAKQSLQLKNITEISSIIDTLKEYVKTNLDLKEVKDYIPYAVEMNMDNVKVAKIPGVDNKVNGIWFFFHDEEETKELVSELFFNIPSDSEQEEESQDNSSTATNET